MIKIKKDGFRTGEVAEIFSVSKPTVRKWCEEGHLSFFKTPGGHRRITSRSVKGMWQTYYIRGVSSKPKEKGVKRDSTN